MSRKLREAANRLLAVICPSGPTYRPPWYNTMGLDDSNNVIILYVLKRRLAHKALQTILSNDKKWEGFPVVVKKMGPIRLCNEEPKAEIAPPPPQEEKNEEFGAGIFD